MSRKQPPSQTMGRIVCSVHRSISSSLINCLKELHQKHKLTVFMESCRSVRQIRRSRPFGLPGSKMTLDDAPGDRFTISADPNLAYEIMDGLAKNANIDIPGHGSVYVQQVSSFLNDSTSEVSTDAVCGPSQNLTRPYLQKLSQITCILSSSGAGEQIAKIALELGTCVPVITLGKGTGIRDKLGLLRVTIPPEKELVHLLVPSHDSEGIIQLLIEDGRFDRPGGGFIYQVPVEAGLIDTRMRIGKQEHAASIEQIITAIDELKKDTTWRKRFVLPRSSLQYMKRSNKEITAVCVEGSSDDLIRAAMDAGAAGATVSKTKRIIADPVETAARELCSIIVPSRQSMRIIKAILEFHQNNPNTLDCLEMIDAPLSYSYKT